RACLARYTAALIATNHVTTNLIISDHVPIVKTTRNLTLPLCICSYASATRSNGYFSIIGCTPVNALNSIVSCESRAVPEYQPATELRWLINENILIDNGSAGAAGTSNSPLGAKPSTNGEIAAALGAVARMTRAPPSFCNSATTSVAVASM